MNHTKLLCFLLSILLFAQCRTSHVGTASAPPNTSFQQLPYYGTGITVPGPGTDMRFWSRLPDIENWSLQPGNFNVTIDSLVPGKEYILSGRIRLTPVNDTMIVITPDTIVTEPPVNIEDAAKIGSCVFPWTGLARVKALGMKTVRVYCPIHWWYTKDGYFGDPFYQAYTNEAPGIKAYLEQAKALGIEVIFCGNQTPEWIRSTGNGTNGNDFPPIRAGLDRNDPKSYAEIAEVYRQLVMRFGAVKHKDSDLKVNTTPQYANQPINQKLSGLGLLKKLELGNELDHWFEGFASEKYLNPEEHAALLVACVKAIRSADPGMELYMAGITDLNLWYLKRTYAQYVKLWPEGAKFFPHINVHHYSNILNKPGTDKPTWAVSGGCYPENDPAFSQINEIVRWAHGLGLKCVVTEFGYDKLANGSMMHIKGNGISDEQAQAIGINKSYRAYLAADVDGAYVFEFADEAHLGQFASCGIVGKQGNNFLPQFASYNAIKELIRELTTPGYVMQAVRDPGNAPPGTLQAGQTVKIGDMRKAAKKMPTPPKEYFSNKEKRD